MILFGTIDSSLDYRKTKGCLQQYHMSTTHCGISSIFFPWGLGDICSTVLVMEELQEWPMWEGGLFHGLQGISHSAAPWASRSTSDAGVCFADSHFFTACSISCPFLNTFSQRCIQLNFWAQPHPTMCLWWLYLAEDSFFSPCRHPAANTLPWTSNTEGKVKCKTCQLSQVSWKQAEKHQMQVCLHYITISSEGETNSTTNSSLQLQFSLNLKTSGCSTCR